MQRLDAAVLHMGSLVAAMLHDAMASLVSQDVELAAEVRDRDARVNQLDEEIEGASIRLLALQHPVAGDLRRITSALKVITDLERVGDYATDIAKCTIACAGRPYFKPLEDLPEMARVVEGMLSDVVKSWADRDVESGKQVRDRDKMVDRLYQRVLADIIGWMEREPHVVAQGAQLLLVARYLERLGDHIKNVVERLAYAETGFRRPWRTEEWKLTHRAEPKPQNLDDTSVDHEE
jgi:phosphate transport system protein